MKRRGSVVGGGGYRRGNGICFVLAVIDLDAKQPKPELIELPFLPHGLALDPKDPGRAVVFEKKGPGAAVVHLGGPRSFTRAVETDRTRKFYGHGVFSAEGNTLFATEARLDDALAGVLVVRDARTFDELGHLPTGGASPHDCELRDDGRTLVITNGGGAFHAPGSGGSVAFIDVATGKIVELVPIPDPRFNAGHVMTSARGDLAVVSAPREELPPDFPSLGALTLRPLGAPARTMTEPAEIVARMRGETLSVLLDAEHDVVFATHPQGHCVTVWRLSDGSWLETIELRDPRGIARTLDGSAYLVSHAHGPSPRLSVYARPSREPLGAAVDPSFLTGSHVYVCPL